MAEKSILLFTNSRDLHACAADYVLRALEATPTLINTAKIPNGEALSVHFVGDEATIRLGDFERPVDEITSVWLRRISKRFLLPGNADPADRKHIRDNCRTALHGVLRLLDDRFPVNPLAAKTVHSLKIMQLAAAKEAGFRIPRTLVSNDYLSISAFAQATPRVCVKSYYPQGWRGANGNVHAVTTMLDSVDDFDRRSFEIMPHIYQEFIDKRAEHRLTIFGNFHASIAIDMNALEGQSNVDWRSDLSYLSHIQPSRLPDRVIAAARKVLKRCGLRFGTFDIAETPDGEFVFFEVNEAGQWLWIETSCPEVRLLQPFCEFLMRADESFASPSLPQREELGAESVLAAIKDDARYQGILSAEFSDAPEYLAVEDLEIA